MLVKFEKKNRMVPTTRNFELFDKKKKEKKKKKKKKKVKKKKNKKKNNVFLNHFLIKR